MAFKTSNLEFFQAGAWNAAAIASKTSRDTAIGIINEMALEEKNCDSSDWETLCVSFGGEEVLRASMESLDIWPANGIARYPVKTGAGRSQD